MYKHYTTDNVLSNIPSFYIASSCVSSSSSTRSSCTFAGASSCTHTIYEHQRLFCCSRIKYIALACSTFCPRVPFVAPACLPWCYNNSLPVTTIIYRYIKCAATVLLVCSFWCMLKSFLDVLFALAANVRYSFGFFFFFLL